MPTPVSGFLSRSDSESEPSYPSLKPKSTAVPVSSLRLDSNIDSKRHPYYYLPDGNRLVIIQDILFNIHQYFLDRDCKKLPKPNALGKITLSGITVPEFVAVLDFWYQGMYDDYLVDINGWIDLLSASYALGMPKLRVQAIKEVDKSKNDVDPVRKILLARKFDVASWLRPSLEELCRREQGLSIEEAQLLDLNTTVNLFLARESVLQAKINGFGSMFIDHVSVAVTKMFPESSKTVALPPQAVSTFNFTKADDQGEEWTPIKSDKKKKGKKKSTNLITSITKPQFENSNLNDALDDLLGS